jgi:hypothetical protein
VGAAGVHASFYQKCSDTLQIGAELESNWRMMESVATVGYQLDIPKSNFTFKGKTYLHCCVEIKFKQFINCIEALIFINIGTHPNLNLIACTL